MPTKEMSWKWKLKGFSFSTILLTFQIQEWLSTSEDSGRISLLNLGCRLQELTLVHSLRFWGHQLLVLMSFLLLSFYKCMEFLSDPKHLNNMKRKVSPYNSSLFSADLIFIPKKISTKSCQVRIRTHPGRQNKTSARCLKITEKVSFKIASEASYVYILSGQMFIKNDQFRRVFENLKLEVKKWYQTFWVDKSSSKMPKLINFGEFLKTWSKQCYQTGHF